VQKKQDTLISHHRVASYELDSFGHVNNAVFLNYLEKARCDFLRARGSVSTIFLNGDGTPS